MIIPEISSPFVRSNGPWSENHIAVNNLITPLGAYHIDFSISMFSMPGMELIAN